MKLHFLAICLLGTLSLTLAQPERPMQPPGGADPNVISDPMPLGTPFNPNNENCPADTPTDGDSCDEPMWCEYTISDYEFRHASCRNGIWNVATAMTTTIAPPTHNNEKCPEKIPESDTSCDEDMWCEYTVSEYEFRHAECAGGSWSVNVVMTTTTPPGHSSENCPEEIPTEGDACTEAELFCQYTISDYEWRHVTCDGGMYNVAVVMADVTPFTPPGPPDCAPENYVNCFVDPCSVANCPARPDAVCVSNYCGGCNDIWWTREGRVDCESGEIVEPLEGEPSVDHEYEDHHVSISFDGVGDYECVCRRKGEGMPEPPRPTPTPSPPMNPSCPVVMNDMVGICVEECSSDRQCTGSKICCSNGCGHQCMDPMPMACTEDARTCSDGTVVVRDPMNNCEFPACSAESAMCATDVIQCPDGTFASRDPANNCEFHACPPFVMPTSRQFGDYTCWPACRGQTTCIETECVPDFGQ